MQWVLPENPANGRKIRQSEPDLTLSLSQSHSLSFTHSRHTEQLLFSCPCSKVPLSHTHSLSLLLTLTLFQSLIQPLLTCWTTFVFMSMLKSHSLTLTLSHSLNVSLSHSHSFTFSFTHSRHAEQVLSSCLCSKVTVYSRKLQWFFDPVSLDVTDLVPSERVTFEHRHENKSCSVWREWVNERLWDWESERVRHSDIFI